MQAVYDKSPAKWNLYVILLDDNVADGIHPPTHDNNGRNKGQCVYVGCTTKAPEKREIEHKKGSHPCKKIDPRDFDCLMYWRFEHINLEQKELETYEQASKREFELARELESKGFRVWCYR